MSLRKSRTSLVSLSAVAALALTLGACADTGEAPVTPTNDGGSESTDSTDDGDAAPSGGGEITIGTTDKVNGLDPAGTYDNGSFVVQNQIYPFVMNTPYGSPDVEPDIAVSAEFTAPTEYTVTLKEGLTFANGNALTSSDVKFTFDRQVAINDPNGPASLLANLDSVEAPDDLTVVFHLKSENDQTFPQVLSSPVGPIVDEEVFSATEVTPDDVVLAGNGFAGQYTITDYTANELVRYQKYDGYQGVLGAAQNDVAIGRYYTREVDLKTAVQSGEVDVAFRSLSPTDLADLRTDSNVTVHDGPGGEIRYIVFNFDIQPYGTATPEADEGKALAVRQAMAHLLDRDALSEEVYQGTYTPLYSYVASGQTGATESLKALYGDGNGGPSLDNATKVLADAGVQTPVVLNLQYSPDHYGNSSDEEYAMIEQQLENGGLFDVNLQSTLWDVYANERIDSYPVYQLGWFPDYSDSDNYLTPFFLIDNFLGNDYVNQEVNDLILKQVTTVDRDERTGYIEEIQDLVAQDLSTLPYLQGSQVAVSANDITGVDTTLDPSFKFRYGALGR